MIYDFNPIMDRSKNYSAKHDEAANKFGRKDIIPLWIADMDLKTAQPIIDAMIDRANQGMFGYTSRPERYFELVKEWQKKKNNWDIDTKYMSHSTGVMPMMCHFMREFLGRGKKVIVQPPVYSEFFTAVEDWGGELLYNPLHLIDGDYYIDFDDLEEKAKQGAKYLIICNPHNPVGRVWTKEELTKVGKICLDNGVMVISDEIHSDLMLWENKHIPMASISEEFARNTVTCISATKTFNLAGLQVSTTVFPNIELKEKYEDVQGRLDSKRNNCFSLVSNMAAYEHGEEWLDQLLVYLEGNIDYIINFCKENIPQIKPNRPNCTYLMWLDCKDLGLDGDDLVDFFINKAKLGLNDGRSFGEGGEGYMRLNVACSRLLLEKAMNQLKEAVLGL
ncbi:PatB family C-S lyase [Clostridium sp. CCUG 7971]|uniref:MalY/PatB family protein n=1 Tax=Clostridium sp. CCUG 7971 TaxID=2811414 RepID=UPI001ABB8415|nr:PatB family C-S lyase [Clostridium sp. CCUG 7971]MBO3444100.1 PatB family C-S lyase [Clostridium sp. CCUG 7971]